MINIETLLKIKEKNELTIEATIWLWLIEEGSYHLMDGYVNSGDEITEKGRNYLKSLKLVKEKDIDYRKLYSKIAAKMLEITGKKQIVLQQKYSFFPNEFDFTEKLYKVIKKYKLNNTEKVEKCLIRHIQNCKKANWEKVQLMKYFIMKDNSSSLVDMYNSWEEGNEEIKENLEPTQIKDLF